MRDRVFRDPVHGLIELRGDDRALQAILETRAFQRLRRIKQMGFAWLVYPGAEHSRFGHALGALHIAQRVTRALGIDRSAPRVARHVVVAALLHDLGHGPFSHAWEHVFSGAADHEQWGARIVTEDDELRAVLEELEPELPATLRRFWDKSYEPAFARKLVSSQLDVDRLDYLLRDGHYSGAGYATYDLDWILHALQVGPTASSPEPTDLVVDYRRGMFAVEQYLFARSYMYAQVYHHKTVRAAEWLFIKLMQRFGELARAGREPPHLAPAGKLARGEPLTVSEYLWLDDVSVLSAADRWAGRYAGDGTAAAPADDPVLADLARRLVSRRLFKTFDLGDDEAIAERIRPEVLAVARRHFGDDADSYVAIDAAHQVGYAAAGGDELHVVGHPRHGDVTLGTLLAAMPLGRPMAAVRLLFAPELRDELRPIAERALAAVRDEARRS